jgi:hypothetical protein
MLIVAAGALVAGGIVAAGVAGDGFGDDGIGTAFSSGAAVHRDVVQQSATGVQEIVVRIDGGIIRLHHGSGPDVQVRTTKLWDAGPGPVLGRRLESGVLTVTADCHDLMNGCRTEHDLDVPSGTAVRIKARGAQVEATDLDTPRFAVETGAGSVSASFVTAPDAVRVETAAGPVSLRVPPGRHAVTAETVIGLADIGVINDPTATRTIEAHTVSGPVEVVAR